ncbi:unnamed protein product, partial [Hapterophycus canaliculatus]
VSDYLEFTIAIHTDSIELEGGVKLNSDMVDNKEIGKFKLEAEKDIAL